MKISKLKKLYLQKTVKVIIDRPINSKHPQYGFVYVLNYGYVPNTVSGDGEEIDVYVIDSFQPLSYCSGKVIAIIKRDNDNDYKLIVSCSGKNFSIQEITDRTYFQEQFFKIKIYK